MSEEDQHTGRISKIEKQIDDLHTGFTDIRQDLNLIKIALLGSESLGVDGMTQKQNKMEVRLSEFTERIEAFASRIEAVEKMVDRIKYKALGFGAGGAGSAWIAIEKLF